MNAYLQKVLDGLNAGGFPACRANSPEVRPDVSAVCAAVSLQLVDHTRAEILVEVFAPSGEGGGCCEDAAAEMAALISRLGGQCSQGACRFDGDADAFRVPLTAVFKGETAAVIMDHFTVSCGFVTLPTAVSFRAWREVDLVDISLNDAPWRFRIEERFGPGEVDTMAFSEPFDVTVVRGNIKEMYLGATWTSYERIMEPAGMKQIREGVAKAYHLEAV